ncbi:MAG TPA: hypothetical protein VFW23_00455 [Tepidisphaeraceae bacterium]|nr:hypothetical protein [Tepidisphaeraceae bacterium]
MIELLDSSPSLDVQPAEYNRLLGFPRNHILEGRAKELADAARDWYVKHGKPWTYSRHVSEIQIASDLIRIEDEAFTSSRLRNTLLQAEANGAVLVAASAGPEVEEEAQRLWLDEKPDEYFFLEVFGSAVVEHLITMAGAKLCDWAERQGMAVLPHYSPGYPEWDISEQWRLFNLILGGASSKLPGPLEVLKSGMLRPKKSLLAVFGLTKHTSRVAKLTDLNPCENCSYTACQYRRAAYHRAPRRLDLDLGTTSSEIIDQPSAPVAPLDLGARYSVNTKALARWAAERLKLGVAADGSIDALFHYEGTTCSNMGRALRFHYTVKLGPAEQGYPILAQKCVPAPGEDGYTYMCRYRNEPELLMTAIEQERPLFGHPLNDVLTWTHDSASAGCYCDPSSRDHKWALVLQTIHFALAKGDKPKAVSA